MIDINEAFKRARATKLDGDLLEILRTIDGTPRSARLALDPIHELFSAYFNRPPPESEAECTADGARWCPNCGACTCEVDARADSRCPLHGLTSNHNEALAIARHHHQSEAVKAFAAGFHAAADIIGVEGHHSIYGAVKRASDQYFRALSPEQENPPSFPVKLVEGYWVPMTADEVATAERDIERLTAAPEQEGESDG